MENNSPFFSVVVPSFNRADLISIAIQSVINQTFSNWELIIVDDGSSDNTRDIVSSFTDSRIKYIKTPNCERGAARNTGIRGALGEFVILLDSDDYLLPEHMTSVLNIIQANPTFDFIHLNYEFRNKEGKLVRAASKLPSILNKVIVGTNVIGCAGVVMKLSLAIKYPFSEVRWLSGTEDYELWLRIAAENKLYHFPLVTTVMVEHKGRSMAELDIKKIEKRILLFIHLCKNSKSIRKFLGRKKNYFISNRFSYISLHASVTGNTQLSLKYWCKSFISSPLFCISKRSFSIVNNLLFK